MVDIASLVDGLGGMAQKRSLVRRGARDLDLTRAVRRGDVRRARQGWYTTLPENVPAVQAVRIGGRLTGISAVIAEGGWVLGKHALHVSVHNNAARLRSRFNRRVRFEVSRAHGVVLHWDDSAIAERGTTTSVGLIDALVRVCLDEPLETAVAAIDWALHTGRLDVIDFEILMQMLPITMQYIRDWVDRNCESLPESIARTRLRLAGHHVTLQVPVGDNERIDLLVDDCIALETDGEEFHRDRFHADRSKDLSITIAGHHCLRATAKMVFHSWDRVMLAVEAAIAARKPPDSLGTSGNRRIVPPAPPVRQRPHRCTPH